MRYLCHGYEQSLDEIVNGALFASDNDEMVIVRDIELYSLCEHHLLPFIGKAHVAYIPTGKVLGLSKVARIVDMFARRLQIQENLTRQIAEAIRSVTGAAGVAVVIEAQHMCMMMRGVEKQNSQMLTSVMLGAFRELDDPSRIPATDWTEQVTMPRLEPGMARIRVRTCACAPSSGSRKKRSSTSRTC